MSKAVLFLTNGFEETEALVTVDILRRGGVLVTTVSLTDDLFVKGSHEIIVKADTFFDEALALDFDMLILPGGPGTKNYYNHTGLSQLIQKAYSDNKYLAAICAAPTVFGRLGLLEGKNAICYTGMEDELTGAILSKSPVVTDGKITTAIGAGASILFSFRLLEILEGESTANKVKSGFIFLDSFNI